MVSVIPEGDIRHHRATEVRIRLGQLDLILNKLKSAIEVVTPDPREIERVNSWTQEHYSAFRRGEISAEQWIRGTYLASQVEPRDYLEAWDSINLFTESFYFFAWRLREILHFTHRDDPLRFPKLDRVSAEIIRRVRNELLEHPEDHNRPQSLMQNLVVTSSGPALRTTEVAIESAANKTIPTESSVDKGLYVNARKFRDELQGKFGRAIHSLTSLTSQDPA